MSLAYKFISILLLSYLGACQPVVDSQSLTNLNHQLDSAAAKDIQKNIPVEIATPAINPSAASATAPIAVPTPPMGLPAALPTFYGPSTWPSYVLATEHSFGLNDEGTQRAPSNNGSGSLIKLGSGGSLPEGTCLDLNPNCCGLSAPFSEATCCGDVFGINCRDIDSMKDPVCCKDSGYNCFDADSDPKNCGSCGNTCSANQICCNGSCSDINSNNSCGTCGNQCTGGDICCSVTITDRTEYRCVDGTTRDNCGSCNNNCSSAGPTGGICCNINGEYDCTATDTNEHCGGCDACSSGQICCSFLGISSCKNLNEIRNCSQCNSICTGDTPDCCQGQCTNTESDILNCGSCENTCPDACTNGQCS